MAVGIRSGSRVQDGPGRHPGLMAGVASQFPMPPAPPPGVTAAQNTVPSPGGSNDSPLQDISAALALGRQVSDQSWAEAGFGPGGAAPDTSAPPPPIPLLAQPGFDPGVPQFPIPLLAQAGFNPSSPAGGMSSQSGWQDPPTSQYLQPQEMLQSASGIEAGVASQLPQHLQTLRTPPPKRYDAANYQNMPELVQARLGAARNANRDSMLPQIQEMLLQAQEKARLKQSGAPNPGAKKGPK